MRKFNLVRVFSATKAHDRDRLGDQVTDWLRSRPDLEIEDVVITQSSDSEFHCLAITVLAYDKLAYDRSIGLAPPVKR